MVGDESFQIVGIGKHLKQTLLQTKSEMHPHCPNNETLTHIEPTPESLGVGVVP